MAVCWRHLIAECKSNFLSSKSSCWWCSWHKHQIKWALAPKSIVIVLHGLSWDVTSILQTGLVATRSLKSRPKIKMRESSTLRVKFILCRCWTWYYSDTLVLSLYSPPTSDFKGNNQRIFHWRTSGSWQISCFLHQGSMRNVIKQIHLSWNHQLSLLCFNDTPDLLRKILRQHKIKLIKIIFFTQIIFGKYILIPILSWSTVVCHDLEWKTSNKPTDLPLLTS